MSTRRRRRRERRNSGNRTNENPSDDRGGNPSAVSTGVSTQQVPTAATRDVPTSNAPDLTTSTRGGQASNAHARRGTTPATPAGTTTRALGPASRNVEDSDQPLSNQASGSSTQAVLRGSITLTGPIYRSQLDTLLGSQAVQTMLQSVSGGLDGVAEFMDTTLGISRGFQSNILHSVLGSVGPALLSNMIMVNTTASDQYWARLAAAHSGLWAKWGNVNNTTTSLVPVCLTLTALALTNSPTVAAFTDVATILSTIGIEALFEYRQQRLPVEVLDAVEFRRRRLLYLKEEVRRLRGLLRNAGQEA